MHIIGQRERKRQSLTENFQYTLMFKTIRYTYVWINVEWTCNTRDRKDVFSSFVQFALFDFTNFCYQTPTISNVFVFESVIQVDETMNILVLM